MLSLIRLVRCSDGDERGSTSPRSTVLIICCSMTLELATLLDLRLRLCPVPGALIGLSPTSSCKIVLWDAIDLADPSASRAAAESWSKSSSSKPDPVVWGAGPCGVVASSAGVPGGMSSGTGRASLDMGSGATSVVLIVVLGSSGSSTGPLLGRSGVLLGGALGVFVSLEGDPSSVVVSSSPPSSI